MGRVMVALLATIIVEESTGLSRWAAIRLVRWAASQLYAANPARAAAQAEEWEKRVTDSLPSHLIALCFACSMGGWTIARILTRHARAITDAPEGRSAMTVRRQAEAMMRWAAYREYSDQPERAETRAEEWAHDVRQAAARGSLRGLATGLPHVFSALWGPAHQRQRLVMEGDHLMVQFEQGKISGKLLTDSVLALIQRARESGLHNVKSFEPIRCAAVDRLSAARAAELARVLLTAGMPGEAAAVVQAWPVPELTAHRSADDLIPICRALKAVWPDGPGGLTRLLSGSVSHWAPGKRLQAEATIRHELDADQEPDSGREETSAAGGG
jgi:hypothetical protein